MDSEASIARKESSPRETSGCEPIVALQIMAKRAGIECRLEGDKLVAEFGWGPKQVQSVGIYCKTSAPEITTVVFAALMLPVPKDTIGGL